MSTQSTYASAMSLSALCMLLAALPVQAQARFQVLTQDGIAEVSGLRIATIRDNQLSACFTLFIMEPQPAAETVEPTSMMQDWSPYNEFETPARSVTGNSPS